ncbi:tetratricopeptide repeat protein [Aggregatibacter kilianii]|uniref:tetratricopeptide repeat protein n=1 Tax=Aggregatibacter kilianii TaxID=2025884 RepID=UPI001EF8360F|nr:tetratricopeptide repeat protein [Aggregatibacter kilianii]
MSVDNLIKEIVRLFEDKKLDEAITKLNQAWDEIEDKRAFLQEQNNIQFWLGRCYLEKAIKIKNAVEANELFEQAIGHYEQQLALTGQLEDGLRKQNNVLNWLGYCYFEQAMKNKRAVEVKKLFEEAINHLQQQLNIAEQQQDSQEQKNAHFGLGRCYLEQAIKTRYDDAEELFELAIEHHKYQLELIRQVTNGQTLILEHNDAQFSLGRCYFEWAIKVKCTDKAKGLFEQAIIHHQQQLNLAEQLQDIQTKIQRQGYAQSWIDRCYRNISFLEKNWPSYWEKKKQDICRALFSNMSKRLDREFEDAVSTILAVLYIPPIELGSTPLAHYTSSTVCNKLFGVVNEKDSKPMRIGSSSYMNDPSEGKGLMELLALPDLELENKTDCSPHNAFFACFSSRVNDLNQFRLYGKEDGVEASGCCLVFNKNRDWLKEPDISAPFRDLIKNMDENSAKFKETDISNVEYEKLPLYQVAYIAYKDEYIAEEKCERWLDNSFGICLKPIGGNENWHSFRLDQLKEALQKLVGFFKEKEHVNDKNKNALEYIRYLFKDFAFRDEEEFRVLKIAEIGSEEIKYCKTTKSIYLPYADISNVVDEVILGTNYEKTNSRHKAEVFQHQMKQKCPYVKVSRSSLPIYANPPIKKD